MSELSSRDLRPLGPLSILDRAFSLARTDPGGVVVPSLFGGALFACAGLFAWYVERVEGITSARLPLALLLSLAWWARAYFVGRGSRAAVRSMWQEPLPHGAGRPLDVLRTSMVVALGLWVWAWLLVLGSLAGAIGIALVIPILCFRGAVAPSWIARSACEPEAGFRGFFRAAGDSSGKRAVGITVELLLLIGALGLAIDLFALIAVALLLVRSFGGIDVSVIDSFFSLKNGFVLLSIGALALVLLEPLRAAVSASLYVDARVRAEGLDLRLAIDEAIAHATRGRSGSAKESLRAAAIIIAFACASSMASEAAAQPPPAFPPPPVDDDGQPIEPAYDPNVPAHDPNTAPAYDPNTAPAYDPNTAPAYDPNAQSPNAQSDYAHDDSARDDYARDDYAYAEPPPYIPAANLQPGDSEVQEDLQAILARDEFREFEDDRSAGLSRLFERLFDWLSRRQIEEPEAPGVAVPAIPLPGAGFFLVIGALLLVFVLGYLVMTRKREKEETSKLEADAKASADPRERAPSSFLDEAADLASSGHFREALRALYLATLVALDRRRLIAFDPHLTNWQYLRQMPHGDERGAFRQFTHLFDHKWYGAEPTTHDDYERCRDLARAIVGQESP
ncbi:MAG: DUF4129 domain-containing protein [Sandaracinaceae bacterium]|nr:DUF4129 domain-containing protein [Sandaracinaceae bacterium]